MEPCRPETDIGRRGAAPTVAGPFGKGGSRGTATGIETTIRSCEVDANAIDPVCTRTDAIDKGTAGDEGRKGTRSPSVAEESSPEQAPKNRATLQRSKKVNGRVIYYLV